MHRSYDVLGGPGSFSALWTTAKFRENNPKTTKAVLAAMDEASAFIKENPKRPPRSTSAWTTPSWRRSS